MEDDPGKNRCEGRTGAALRYARSARYRAISAATDRKPAAIDAIFYGSSSIPSVGFRTNSRPRSPRTLVGFAMAPAYVTARHGVVGLANRLDRKTEHRACASTWSDQASSSRCSCARRSTRRRGVSDVGSENELEEERVPPSRRSRLHFCRGLPDTIQPHSDHMKVFRSTLSLRCARHVPPEPSPASRDCRRGLCAPTQCTHAQCSIHQPPGTRAPISSSRKG